MGTHDGTRNPSSISVKLKQAIEQAQAERGLTVYRIAIESGVPQPMIHRFLKGERPDLSLQTVDKLCAYLGITISLTKNPQEPLTLSPFPNPCE